MRKSVRKKLIGKLRSERGASITFALLLFLVCAVIGSVVLTAGTAASGRISQLAQSDQRYYAVTSAAQLFREELKNQSFTIVRTKETKTAYSTKYLDENGDFKDTGTEGDPTVDVLGAPGTPEYSYTIQNTGVTPAENITDEVTKSLMAQAALDLVFGGITPGTEDSWDVDDAFGTVPASDWPKKLRVSVDGEEATAVDVTMELKSNGDICFTFKDHKEGSETEHYSVSFTLTLQSGSTPELGKGDLDGEKDGQYYYAVDTKTNRLSWIASEIGSGS